MSSPAQPFIDMRNKLVDWSNKAEGWLSNAPQKTPATAKQLGWADQSTMRKLTPEGPKLGQKKTTKKKAAPKSTARKSE